MNPQVSRATSNASITGASASRRRSASSSTKEIKVKESAVGSVVAMHWWQRSSLLPALSSWASEATISLIGCGELRLELQLPVADGEVLLVAMGPAPSQNGVHRCHSRQDLVSKEQEFSGKANHLGIAEQVVPSAAEHVVPVGEPSQNATDAASVGPARLARGGPHKVVAECPEDVTLIVLGRIRTRRAPSANHRSTDTSMPFRLDAGMRERPVYPR